LNISQGFATKLTHKEAVPFMEWNAENIRQLRANAQITQAQLAGWLGVTVKQVKHLENRRRNPSGPVERLLDMFAKQHDELSIQVLNASHRQQPQPRPVAEQADAPPANDALVWDN
jgi:DNA-binding transcriptional regulator YiaG